MAVMKKSKRKDLTREDAQKELSRIEQELRAELSTRGSSGKPKNSGKFREMKRFRATLLGFLSQKSKPAAPSAPVKPAASATKPAAKSLKVQKAPTASAPAPKA